VGALGLRVKFKGTTLQEFAARYLVDVGPTGMFIRTTQPLAVGTQVRFELTLENDAPLLSGDAVVVWVAEENKDLNLPSGMELRFDALTSESESRFHWLQMQKRGVTVGRDVPASVSPAASSPAGADAAPADVLGAPTPAVLSADAAALQLDAEVPIRPPLPHRVHATKPVSGEIQTVDAHAPTGEAPAPVTHRPAHEPPPAQSDPGRLFHAVVDRSRPSISAAAAARPGAATHEQLRELRSTGARNARSAFLWGVAAGAIILLGWVVYQSSQPSGAPTGRPPRGEPPRAVRVMSEPSGAEVLLDGRLVGHTPVFVQIHGQARLLVRLSGHIAESFVVTPHAAEWIAEGGRLVLPLTVRLQRAAPLEPRPVPGVTPSAATPQKPETAAEPGHRRYRRDRGRKAPAASQPGPAQPEAGAESRPGPSQPEDKRGPEAAPQQDHPSPEEEKKDQQRPATEPKSPVKTKPKVKNPDWMNR